MSSDIVRRLRRAHEHDGLRLPAEAADRIRQLERDIDALQAELAKAREAALEEAAKYHDDLAAQHDACQYESQHHEMMVRLHREFAASIRALQHKEGKTG